MSMQGRQGRACSAARDTRRAPALPLHPAPDAGRRGWVWGKKGVVQPGASEWCGGQQAARAGATAAVGRGSDALRSCQLAPPLEPGQHGRRTARRRHHCRRGEGLGRAAGEGRDRRAGLEDHPHRAGGVQRGAARRGRAGDGPRLGRACGSGSRGRGEVLRCCGRCARLCRRAASAGRPCRHGEAAWGCRLCLRAAQHTGDSTAPRERRAGGQGPCGGQEGQLRAHPRRSAAARSSLRGAGPARQRQARGSSKPRARFGLAGDSGFWPPRTWWAMQQA